MICQLSTTPYALDKVEQLYVMEQTPTQISFLATRLLEFRVVAFVLAPGFLLS
jgi:hypothetical protein